MRELGFSKKWPKLQQDEFTTFRLPRKDSDRGRDWHQGERVNVVYHSRRPDKEYLGVADIVSKEPKTVSAITQAEAIADGFPAGWSEMVRWLYHSHKGIHMGQPINKLTLRWVMQTG